MYSLRLCYSCKKQKQKLSKKQKKQKNNSLETALIANIHLISFHGFQENGICRTNGPKNGPTDCGQIPRNDSAL